jgi:hypothetical protein
MLSLVNGLEAAAGAIATVLQFGYANDWTIIGSIELNQQNRATRHFNPMRQRVRAGVFIA